MDAEQQALLREAMDAVLAGPEPREVPAELLAQGWAEARAEDETFALGALFERAGRHLSPAPLLDLVLPAGDGTPRRPALPLPSQAWPASVSDGHVVVEAMTLGGGSAGEIVVGHAVPDTGAGAVGTVPAAALTWQPREGLDPELEMHSCRGRVPLERVTPLPAVSWPGLRDVLRRCLAHELLGVAHVFAERIDEHVRTREQFGRPLSSWQTVAHRLADVHVEIAGARAALDAACQDGSEVVTAAAKAQAASAASLAATHAQQLFGAIGFTWEQALHRAVRRCLVLDATLGSHGELAADIGARLCEQQSLQPCRVDL
jgi:hypothetical protein